MARTRRRSTTRRNARPKRAVRRNRTLTEAEVTALDWKLEDGQQLTKRESLDYLATFAFNAWENLPERIEEMTQDDLDDVAGVLEAIEDAANVLSSATSRWF